MSSNSDITTPATKAVAVKGDSAGATPRITAKGHGFVAEKILDIAFAEGVKVRRDSDLTELLDAFDVESPVPLEALHAVSLILERAYAENRTLEAASHAPAVHAPGALPPSPPLLDGPDDR